MSVKLDMLFIHSTTREILIYFHSCVANSKRKFKLLCAKLSSSLKYIKVRMAIRLCFCGFCSSFRSRSERPHALQLLIKMLIRLCLMWEGLVLLYQNFFLNAQLLLVYMYNRKQLGLFYAVCGLWGGKVLTDFAAFSFVVLSDILACFTWQKFHHTLGRVGLAIGATNRIIFTRAKQFFTLAQGVATLHNTTLKRMGAVHFLARVTCFLLVEMNKLWRWINYRYE